MSVGCLAQEMAQVSGHLGDEDLDFPPETLLGACIKNKKSVKPEAEPAFRELPGERVWTDVLRAKIEAHPNPAPQQRLWVPAEFRGLQDRSWEPRRRV